MNKIIFCFLFFFFHSSCMGSLEMMPLEIIQIIEFYLDDKSHIRFLSTCKRFHSIYLRPSDYTEKMFQSARKYLSEQDEEEKKKHDQKFNGLMAHEGPINKLNRESIEKFFNDQELQNLTIIEMYGKTYDESSIFDFRSEKIVDAVMQYNPEVFELLFKQDNRHHFNYLDKDGKTFLIRATNSEKVEIVKALLKLSPFLVDRKIKYNNWSNLRSSILFSNEKIIKLFLDDPENDINTQGYLDTTALHEAVEGNKIKYVKLLCTYPSLDINIQSSFGTALHIASEENKIECMKLLLVDPRVDINAQDKYGGTPLHLAVKKNNIECVKLLVNDPRINCNIGNSLGRTPYYYASNPEIKELLTKHTLHPERKELLVKHTFRRVKYGNIFFMFFEYIKYVLIGFCIGIVLVIKLVILVEIMHRVLV